MILGLELNLASSYDLSNVTCYCKDFVASFGRFIPLLVKFSKVEILFGIKQEPTGKFAVCGLTRAAN
jgi:hypothetical protein